MAVLDEAVLGVDVLGGRYRARTKRGVGVVVEITPEAVGLPVRRAGIEGVVPESVVRIIRLVVDPTLHMRGRIHDVQISDLALNREPGLVPIVMGEFGEEMLNLKCAN